MRSPDQNLLKQIQEYVEEQCDRQGYGPTVREVAEEYGLSVGGAYKYLARLEKDGMLSKGRNGYISNSLAQSDSPMRSVAILGAVPCGPLTEVEEYIEGYVRLPESLIGQGKFFILKASGDSMIGAGINDEDLVLIRQQETADVGDIVVALVENEVTLKRLEYDSEEDVYYLHPENPNMDDIFVDQIVVQGVAVKVIKDLN